MEYGHRLVLTGIQTKLEFAGTETVPALFGSQSGYHRSATHYKSTLTTYEMLKKLILTTI